jgi:nitroreductase
MLMKATSTDTAEKAEQLRSEFNEIEKVILRRRSVRNYKKKQVPEFMIKRILEAGRFAPSAGNCQPWKFIVLRDPEIINGITDTVVKICKVFKSMIDYRLPGSQWKRRIANLFIRLKPADLHPTPFGAVSMIADGKLGLWHDSPTVILIFKDVRGISNPDLDCGIAGQNMVLAAHSMGLGTCWVGFTKLAFQYTKKWKKRLNIEHPYKFANSLSIGWPVGEPDGMVERTAHPVDWYEDGSVQTIY